MGTSPAQPQRLPRVIADIEQLEDMIAAVDAADEAAQVLALRATCEEDLDEAELIRKKLGLVWDFLVRERQRYYSHRASLPGATAQGASDSGVPES